ncbi:UrcA family protein [Novosphingobium sp. MW5]|nr:UrcA family protein [Novosphingobium sp. MW5]
MNTKTTQIALVAAALTTLGFATTVQATETSSREISLYGYDLGNPAHVKKIEQRIESAARSVCEMGDNEGLAARVEKQKCFNHAVLVARASVDAQVAAWNAKDGTSVALDTPVKIVGAKR